MKFLNRKPKLLFSCKPDFYSAFELYKPTYAAEFSPPWLKQVPALYDKQDENGITIPGASIKRCPGLQWTLTSGFMLPLWTDIALTINPNGTYGFQCADNKTWLTSHPHEQMPGFFPGYTHIKIISPWSIRCSEAIKFYWTNPYYYYNRPTKFIIAHGMMEYKYNHSSNINLFFPLENEPYKFMIKAGEPMVHMIDTNFTEFDVEYELLKDNLEYYAKNNNDSVTSYVGDYFKRRKKLMKE